MELRLWADGGVNQNGGPGRLGYGVVAVWEGGRREWAEAAEVDHATNNRAELGAIVYALSRLPTAKRADCRVTVYSDSQWSVRSITGQYQSTANRDLIEEAQALLAEYGEGRIEWVRGHNGDPNNERAHTLATQALRQRRAA